MAAGNRPRGAQTRKFPCASRRAGQGTIWLLAISTTEEGFTTREATSRSPKENYADNLAQHQEEVNAKLTREVEGCTKSINGSCQLYFTIQEAAMKSEPYLVVLAVIGLASCASKPEEPRVVKVDKPFAAAGSIEMQLDGGDYTIRAAPDERIRVWFAGSTGNTAAELAIRGAHATLAIRDTPHTDFRGTVEVPATADLAVHLTGGNLEIASVTGNKDIDSKAGNVGISVPNSSDYGTVDASVRVGNLDAGPFGNSGSGLSPHLKWSGPGKYILRASLGAGNLELKR
jgi:hypothetical protein